MSGRRSRTRHALSAAGEGRSRALAPYAHSTADEGRRRSLAPYALRSHAPRRGSAYTRPPAADLLPFWPPPRSGRDYVTRLIVKTLVGPSHLSQRYGAVPEPEAKCAAADIEAEAHAAVSESASGATLAFDAERFEFYRTYCKEFCSRLHDFSKSRATALGAVQELGGSSATALPLAASMEQGFHQIGI
ncbi:hypothetical protein ACQ4PT_066514 [Festuca glaucescens]